MDVKEAIWGPASKMLALTKGEGEDEGKGEDKGKGEDEGKGDLPAKI